MEQQPHMENVVLDVADLNTGVLCSWAVLEERLKPGWNNKASWVLYRIIHILDVFLRLRLPGMFSQH